MSGLPLVLGGVALVAAAWAASHHGTRPQPRPYRDAHRTGERDHWGRL